MLKALRAIQFLSELLCLCSTKVVVDNECKKSWIPGQLDLQKQAAERTCLAGLSWSTPILGVGGDKKT